MYREEANDVYSLLAAKERDLILAAELGKALLEKNEELSKQNERIAEEFSQKLEVSQTDPLESWSLRPWNIANFIILLYIHIFQYF